MPLRTVLTVLLAIGFPVALTAQPPAPPAADTNPLLPRGRRRSACRRSTRSRPSTSCPAFKEAIAQQRARGRRHRRTTPTPPTFANTIEALEDAGELLTKVSAGLQRTCTRRTPTTELQAINREVTPLLDRAPRRHPAEPDAVRARQGRVGARRDASALTPVQKKLLEETYKGFVRGGANLDAGAEGALPRDQRRAVRARRQVRRQPAARDQRLPARHREARPTWRDCPPSVVATGAEAAKAAGLAGKWVYTLQAPSIWPFLQYADNRELRRQILTAYTTRCDHGDAVRQQGQRRAGSPRCGPSARSCSATRPTPTSCSKRTWRRRRTRSTGC